MINKRFVKHWKKMPVKAIKCLVLVVKVRFDDNMNL
jgi:hypothetical protein